MADSAPAMTWTSGLDGRRTWFNRRWLEFTNRGMEAELGDGWAAAVHPEDLERCLETLASHRERRAPFSVDYRLRRADGEWRWIHDTGAPLTDEAGRVVGFIGSCFDVHERKLAEDALRAELAERTRREANQALLGAIAGDFARLSTEDEITRAIGGRLAAHLGISTCSVADFADGYAHVRSAFTRPGAVEAAAAPLKVSDYLDPDLQDEARAGRTVVIADVRADRRVDGARYEALGVRAGVIVPFQRGGEWVHSFAVGAPEARAWRDDEVRLLEEVASRYFPRIERARAEEALRRTNQELGAAHARLEKADRRKTAFLAILSHELRNPLAAISSAGHLLGLAPEGSATAERAREIVKRQASQLAALVDDLLDVSRLDHDKIVLRRTRLDLREVVRHAFDDALATFEGRGIAATLHLGPQPLWVDGDATRLAQIAGNLLANAASFTPGGGRIEVRAEAGPGGAELTVSDTGAGIAPELLAEVFEPFVQAERAGGAARGGLGLGLALVRSLVELHGGRVRAESAGPGQGSRFLVALPMAAAAERAGRTPATPAPRLSILVVEDDPDVGQSLAEVLELDGHRTRLAPDGAAGLAAFAEARPDVLLCDLGLPDQSGHDVVRKVRALPGGREVFIVALTGHAMPEDVARAREAGFDAHLAKPPSLEELGALLARAAAGRGAAARAATGA